jgi:hypothetical protein
MNPVVSWLKANLVFTVVLFVALQGSVAHPVPSADSAEPASCIAPEHRQFDFWAGDWDVFDIHSPTQGWHVHDWIVSLKDAFCGRTIKTRTV